MVFSNNNNKCDKLIDELKLIPHPEGGHFVETFRDSKNQISHIYYLLKKGETSHWHKINKNELLVFYDGDPLQVLLSKDRVHTQKIINHRLTSSNMKSILYSNNFFFVIIIKL